MMSILGGDAVYTGTDQNLEVVAFVLKIKYSVQGPMQNGICIVSVMMQLFDKRFIISTIPTLRGSY